MAKSSLIKQAAQMKDKALRMSMRIDRNRARYRRLPLCTRLFDKRAKRIASNIRNMELVRLMQVSVMLAGAKAARKMTE